MICVIRKQILAKWMLGTIYARNLKNYCFFSNDATINLLSFQGPFSSQMTYLKLFFRPIFRLGVRDFVICGWYSQTSYDNLSTTLKNLLLGRVSYMHIFQQVYKTIHCS